MYKKIEEVDKMKTITVVKIKSYIGLMGVKI